MKFRFSALGPGAGSEDFPEHQGGPARDDGEGSAAASPDL
jgi:hypothetical protein